MPLKSIFTLLFTFVFSLMASNACAQSLPGFKTNTDKRSIELSELMSGGPPKDGIPSVNNPKFISQSNANSWLDDKEPVISLEVNGQARAYPIQILIWHEIVNDELGGIPVLVTFCPLCYSAIVFDRRHDNRVLDFGVSGLLRHSDMIMFDRHTESLWQQFSGEALVGDYTGDELTILPSQLISYAQFKETYPGAEVLSKDTGHRRNYGENPYAGYDDINNTPFMMRDGTDNRMKPMQKVIGVRTDQEMIAYPYSVTEKERVIHDTIGGESIVVFHLDGMASALDNRSIERSRDDGATGVFNPMVNGRQLEFEFRNGEVRDKQTGSTWNISGKAISGQLAGEQLEPVLFGDYFAFAWLVFYPETKIFEN